nr:PQQ-binding-like beta-propeller repeat protein [Armatimonadota bacterium]
MKPRVLACALISILVFAALGTVLAQGATKWPMYRHDVARTGLSDTNALLSSRPVPIWVFPYPEPDVEPVDNDYPPSGKNEANFNAVGTWVPADSVVSPNAYGGNFLYSLASDSGTATWTFPLTTQRSQTVAYYVYVWFPSHTGASQPKHATNALYRVRIMNDSGTEDSSASFRIDQTSGGNWVILSSSPFMVRDDQYVVVELTTSGANGIVVADAVMLEQDLGAVIGSPAFAPGTEDPADRRNDLVVTSILENRRLPIVNATSPMVDEWGNVVRDEDGNVLYESSTIQSGSVRVGAVYGIAAEDDLTTGGADERGLQKWVFPFNTDNWVAGGFSSSPLIGTYNNAEVAYCPALDGQIYVLTTVPGSVQDSARIVWQGPGYLDEPTAPASWTPILGSGRQGDDFLRTTAVTSSGSETFAAWSFDIGMQGKYSFYAWVPPSSQTEPQVPDARYTISVGGTDYAATGDQRSGGRWILLGTYDVGASGTGAGNTTVKLSNVSSVAGGTTTRYVAADAVKVVLSGLGSFDWSSPALSSDGSRIYIGGTGGRLWCFKVGDPDPVWVYPTLDANPIGAIYASPTLDGSSIFIGSTDGHVYSVSAATGIENWVYPSKTVPDSDGNFQVLGEVSSTIAVRGSSLYVGVGSDANIPPMFVTDDTYVGRVICLSKATGALQWIYPDAGEEARGSFLYSSPLIFDSIGTLAIGSSDGALLALDPADGHAKWTEFPDLGNPIYSSPAGAMIPGENIPMAFVGSQSGYLHGIDLRTGNKHWSHALLGAVTSSPALAEGRMYVGDMSGVTWAFSTRAGSGADGFEEWNYQQLPDGPPTPENSDSDVQSVVELDIFAKEQYDSIKDGVTIPDGDLHKLARAEKDYNPGHQPGHSHNAPYYYEWGETAYVIAWNCLDPNDPDSTDDETKWLSSGAGSRGSKFVASTDSTLRLSIRSRGPGDQSDQSTTLTMTDKGSIWDSAAGRPVFFTKYAYVLGTSSSSNTQSPGSRITLSVQELPSTKSDSVNRGGKAAECVAPEHPIPTTQDPVLGTIYDRTKYLPQRVSINNPLALICVDPSGLDGPWYVGVNSSAATTRDASNFGSVVHDNGNRRQIMPWLRSGVVAHGTNSDERRFVACDRSLLSLTGNNISRFRIERSDLDWQGGDAQIWRSNGISTALPWEKPLPPLVGPNGSLDYPDIRSRQLSYAMAESRLDPTQEDVEIRFGGALTVPATDDPWPVGQNPVGQVIAVPRFQPPNMPFIMPATVDSLRASGYTGRVYTFIDSNGDGRLNRSGQLGSSQLVQQSVSGARSEAYREFYAQAHVPADYRVEVGEKTYDIGAVPHGFGLTESGGVSPNLFLPTLGDNAKLRLGGSDTPGVFDPWFKTFTAYNQGNVNMLNLKMAKRVNPSAGPSYNFDLFSDTAEGSIYPSGNNLVSYGAYVPAAAITSALDNRFLTAALTNLPPIMGLTSRTFHKPRVGESPTVLRLPDMPKRLYTTAGFAPLEPPPLPFFSVAVPVGTPTGTYSRSITLFEDANNSGVYDPGEAVGNPLMQVKLTVTENRMTDGFMPGALPQVDLPDPSFSVGDVSPAVYMGPDYSLHMYWSSSRRGSVTGGGGGAGNAPAPGDPWYLYKSSMRLDNNSWALAQPGYTQWWSPTGDTPIPAPGDLATFFDAGPGQVQRNSAKFNSPSIARNPANGQAWLFFGGEAFRHNPVTDTKAQQHRVFYWPLDPNGDPIGQAYSTTKDWTMPKYGVRGVYANIGGPTLWSFWYGGNNNEWRIYYNMSPYDRNLYQVGERDSWSNDARLSLPRGLVSAAEPSIIARTAYTRSGNPKQVLDVVYSAYSQYHKSTDIYLSRYNPDLDVSSRWTADLDIEDRPDGKDEVLMR